VIQQDQLPDVCHPLRPFIPNGGADHGHRTTSRPATVAARRWSTGRALAACPGMEAERVAEAPAGPKPLPQPLTEGALRRVPPGRRRRAIKLHRTNRLHDDDLLAYWTNSANGPMLGMRCRSVIAVSASIASGLKRSALPGPRLSRGRQPGDRDVGDRDVGDRDVGCARWSMCTVVDVPR